MYGLVYVNEFILLFLVAWPAGSRRLRKYLYWILAFQWSSRERKYLYWIFAFQWSSRERFVYTGSVPVFPIDLLRFRLFRVVSKVVHEARCLLCGQAVPVLWYFEAANVCIASHKFLSLSKGGSTGFVGCRSHESTTCGLHTGMSHFGATSRVPHAA